VRLLLSNYRTECDPREVEVPGNPLLTFTDLRAGDGVPGSRGGDTRSVAEFDAGQDAWVWLADGSLWTDIEVVDEPAAPEGEEARMLLDGLGVASVAELKALVDAARPADLLAARERAS
jgi:hypothetical protein